MHFDVRSEERQRRLRDPLDAGGDFRGLENFHQIVPHQGGLPELHRFVAGFRKTPGRSSKITDASTFM
jgi:hypothetical protein